MSMVNQSWGKLRGREDRFPGDMGKEQNWTILSLQKLYWEELFYSGEHVGHTSAYKDHVEFENYKRSISAICEKPPIDVTLIIVNYYFTVE